MSRLHFWVYWMVLCHGQNQARHHAAAAEPSQTAAGPLKVLVFGDSQGDTGPTYRALQDVLDGHKVAATVINKSVGGTRACGWAKDPQALVKAAQQAFDGSSPDLVWYTAGGNDLAQDTQFHKCLKDARSDDDMKTCTRAGNAILMKCTETLLDNLWKTFPEAKVGQYNYDIPCLDTQDCLEDGARIYF